VAAERHQKLAANHILRCLERCLLQGGALDTEALCMIPGRFVWKLCVGLTVLDAFGNLTDAAVLACLAAVRHYRKPCTETATDSSSSSSSTPRLLPANLKEPTPLPIHHMPLAISFALFQNSSAAEDDGMEATTSNNNNANTTSFLIDPTQQEERCQTGSITIAMKVH